MKVFIVSTMLIAAVLAAPGVMDNQVQSDSSLSYFAKILGNCADSGDLTGCLSIKGITALNRASRANKIELFPGLSFTRDSSVSVRDGKALSENEIVASLPVESEERNGRLLDLALDSASNFLSSHNLQFKLPTEATESLARALEEGRKGGKLKKVLGPLLLGVAAKLFAVVPLLLGGLALLATKALIVAKIAFFLAAGLGLSKFLGGGGGLGSLGAKFGGGLSGGSGLGGGSGWTSSGNQGWSAGSSGSYPYARSYDAHDMAYSAQAPAQ